MRPRDGTGVRPSPLNPVKLELAVVLVAAVVLWLLQGRLSTDPLVQLLLLAGFGFTAMAGLMLRARALAARARRQTRRQKIRAEAAPGPARGGE